MSTRHQSPLGQGEDRLGAFRSGPSAGVGLNTLLPLVPRRASVGYTRFVYAMKLVLPTLAVTLVALVLLWPQLTKKDTSFSVGLADIDTAPGDEPSMLNARYIGTDNKQQPYTITADLARNLDKAGNRVMLVAPKADILREDGTWLIMSADEGLYQKGDETLTLTGSVTLFHDQGYEFRTDAATLDLKSGEAHSTAPVRGQGAFGDMTSEGFIVRDQGQTLIFTGQSRAVLFPAQQ